MDCFCFSLLLARVSALLTIAEMLGEEIGWEWEAKQGFVFLKKAGCSEWGRK